MAHRGPRASREPCPECGTRMAPAMSGLRCPRFGACGRGGTEETVASLRRRPAAHTPAPDRGAAETA